MVCSITEITNSVGSIDKKATREAVKKASKMSNTDRALATSSAIHVLSRLIVEANPTVGGKKINLVNLERKSEGEFIIKYRVGNSKDVIELPLGNRSPFTNSKMQGFNINSGSLETLHSDYGHATNNDDFEELALDITNNPEKILEVAQHLIEADEYHSDASYNDILLGQMSSIQDTLVDMVPTMNVHINNNSNRNYGEIKVKTGDIFIEKGIGGSKSLLEIYVHELYHAITHAALTSKSTEVRKVTSRMEKVRDNFLENTTEADLVKMSGNILTEEQAGDVLDHLTNPEVGLHEFVALAMSNKAVMNQLSTLSMSNKEVKEDRTPLQVVIDMVSELFRALVRSITKEPDGDDLSRMIFFVNKLHTAHKKPLRAKKLLAIRNLISIFDPVDRKLNEYTSKKIDKKLSKLDRNLAKDNEGDLKYHAKLAAKSFYDDQAKDLLGVSASLAAHSGGLLSVLAPEGTIRTILRDASQSDITQDQAEELGLLSGHIDQRREFINVQNSKVVLDYFSKRPTLEQEEMLTSMVLDLDLSTIYATSNMTKLLSSDLEVLAEVKRKEAELAALVGNSNVSNFYNAQTALLANYMVTGKDNIALLMNAENIAKMVGTLEEKAEASKEVVELIDETATLKALRLSSKKDKLNFKALIEEEPNGVEKLVAFQYGQKEKALVDVFPTASDKFKIIKGYSSQITDPDVSIVAAPMSKLHEMKKQGYKLEVELDKHEADNNTTPMGLFKNNRFMETSFHRVGMRLTDKARRGVTVTESFMYGMDTFKPQKAAIAVMKLKNRRSEVIESMFEGTYDAATVADDSLLSPTLNNLGQVVDFRYSMDKETKVKYLDMERKVSVVMGRTAASTYDKKATDSFNQQMMDLILADAEKNKTNKSIVGKNLKTYIKIEEHSDNKDISALWRVLPKSIKSEHKEGFFVRRDLMYTYLGYREMGVENLFGFGIMNKNNDFMKNFKHVLKFAEKLWQEIVKISKIDIIIRTPGVFIGNVVSNFMLMYVSGYSMKEIIELKYQGVKELREYIKGLKESIQLTAKQEAGVISPSEARRLNVIDNNLLNSPVKDLVDAGFYTTIVEEVEHGGDTGSYFNRLAKKKLKGMPKIFRQGLDILYITENTEVFKAAEKGIQASDFAARYAQYHLMIEKGADKADAIKTVRDNFIDYNKPNSRFVEMANKNGFMMFTKYFTRIQRVIRNYGVSHPARLALAIAGQEYLLGDIDDITDQSILTKDMGNLFYNPFDHLMRVLTPSLVEAVNAVVKGDASNEGTILKV